MSQLPLHERKRLQKEMQLLKEISPLILQIAQDDTTLGTLTAHRVQFSKDKGTAYIFFYLPEGQAAFKKILPTLILYKPSLRKALSQLMPRRRVPDLKFKFDALFEKQKKVDDIMAQVSEQLRLNSVD